MRDRAENDGELLVRASAVLKSQCSRGQAPSTVRPLARDPRVLVVGWPLPLGFGLDGRLLLARRGRVCV